jgi:hypothetical protein
MEVVATFLFPTFGVHSVRALRMDILCLRSRTAHWIIYNEPALADDQEQAEDAAEAWAFGAGLLMTDVTLNWRRVTQGRHCHSKRQSG